MGAEVGGRGEGSMAVGVAIDVFFGVEPEGGLAALGVAIGLPTDSRVLLEGLLVS